MKRARHAMALLCLGLCTSVCTAEPQALRMGFKPIESFGSVTIPNGPEPTSQTVTFPRPFSSVLVSNDDGTNEAYIRLFWCGETTAAATDASLEIKAGKTRSFTWEPGTEPDRYCAISLVCAAAETATVRVEGK